MKEMQNLIEYEVQNKSRQRGTRIEGIRLASSPKRKFSEEVKEIVCNPERRRMLNKFRARKDENT